MLRAAVALLLLFGLTRPVQSWPARLPPPAVVTVEAKATEDLRHPLAVFFFGDEGADLFRLLGLCTTRANNDYLIEIDAALEREPERCRQVAAHELGHALGIRDHIEIPECWMTSSLGPCPPPLRWPCPEERLLAEKTSAWKVYDVTIAEGTPPEIARSLRWAVATWNCALRRDALRVK